MPIINGMKMACEPCIRGHRSTKCTHAKERLMVPVRKPGRPLSVCPHPPGKPCSCGGITAAIPRAQKCGCGPGSGASSPAPAAPAAEASALKVPASPTKRTFQIQKSSLKANGRKQSFDLANLERMDPGSYSIHTAQTYGRPTSVRTMSLGNSDAILSPVSTHSPLDYMASLPEAYDRSAAIAFDNGVEFSAAPQIDGRLSLASPIIKAETPRTIIDGITNGSSYFNEVNASSNGTGHSSGIAINGIATGKPTASTAAPKSCCAGKASVPKLNGNGHPKSSPTATAQQPLAHHVQETASNGGATNGFGQINHMSAAEPPLIGAFSQPVVSPLFYAHPADPTIYTYPPYYGTYQHPVLPPQWRQAMPNPAIGYDFTAPGPPMGPHGSVMNLGGGEATPARFGGLSHQCTCGDACNCLGCPAHPYNEATQDYVRSAMNSMAEGRQGGQGGGSGGGRVAPAPPVGADAVSPTTTPAPGACCGGGGGGGGGGTEPSSPAQAQTPSEASAASEDQTQLSESDFLFVTYPFGCEGETASCLCGDDCQCVGCLIHSHAYQSST